ncbi:MAG: nuclear transport factor 2 family protein [Planctomycetes bacterium]|nr:nuclear transport factor 2 family protein [Planctomycetota bacterium]MBI3844800.1 nuclear transport factor 2 family protein [Planctomycetota bacterium]
MSDDSIAANLTARKTAGAAASRESMDGDESNVRAIAERFVRAWNAKDWPALVANYTDPHVDANESDPIVHNAEFEAQLRRMHADADSSLIVTSDDVLVEGRVGHRRSDRVTTMLRGVE